MNTKKKGTWLPNSEAGYYMYSKVNKMEKFALYSLWHRAIYRCFPLTNWLKRNHKPLGLMPWHQARHRNIWTSNTKAYKVIGSSYALSSIEDSECTGWRCSPCAKMKTGTDNKEDYLGILPLLLNLLCQ